MVEKISSDTNVTDPEVAPSERADSELLMRFVRHREQEAFERLVEKYAAMVLGVCKQVLRDPHEAEDVFQATFLILAQRARKIQNKSSVGAWLHKTAYRAAVKAARRRQKRRKRQGGKMIDTLETEELGPWKSIARQEEQAMLHEVLDNMPSRYREVLVLCYLQGMSQTEVADELDLTVGVVKGRVTRGKRVLRMRLLRRGIALSAAFITASASVAAAQAATVPSLVAATAETCAATVLHGNTSVFQTNIGTIAKEGMTTMTMTLFPKIASAAAVLLTATIALNVVDGTEGSGGSRSASRATVRATGTAEPVAGNGSVFLASEGGRKAKPMADDAPTEYQAPKKSKVLAEHRTIARYEGAAYRECSGNTGACPVACGNSGEFAAFAITDYLHYDKKGEYGDDRKANFQIQISDYHKKPIGDKKLGAVLAGLKKGDLVQLDWDHTYDGHMPTRPVLQVKKITAKEAERLRKGSPIRKTPPRRKVPYSQGATEEKLPVRPRVKGPGKAPQAIQPIRALPYDEQCLPIHLPPLSKKTYTNREEIEKEFAENDLAATKESMKEILRRHAGSTEEERSEMLDKALKYARKNRGEILKVIVEQVDFTKEEIVIFKWIGDVTMTYTVVEKDGEKTILFYDPNGPERAGHAIPGGKIFVIPKGSKWIVMSKDALTKKGFISLPK